jgi:hypothetical protein
MVKTERMVKMDDLEKTASMANEENEVKKALMDLFPPIDGKARASLGKILMELGTNLSIYEVRTEAMARMEAMVGVLEEKKDREDLKVIEDAQD